MKHVRIAGAGLCLVAVLALSAMVASAAQAAGPEWGRCVAQSKGHYEDSNCTKEKFKETKGVKKYSGKYEWKAGAPAAPGCEAKKHGNYIDSACTKEKEKKGVVEPGKGKFEKFGPKFTGEGGKGVLAATVYSCKVGEEEEPFRLPRADCTNGGRDPGQYVKELANLEVECTSEHAIGEATGTNSVANVSVRFNGCKIFGSNPCKSPGAAPEEVLTQTLKGHLGYIEKAGAKVGVQLEPVTPGGRFTTMECENIESTVVVGVGNATEGAFWTPEATGGNDGIISPITPVNAMTTKFTQEYTANANRENIPSHFEGGPNELLEMYNAASEEGNTQTSSWSPAGQEIKNVDTLEGEEEIKA